MNFNGNAQGKAKLVCWSTCPTDPTLGKKQKIILQNSFGQLAFFNLLFSAF